jgi:hypothetical protein
MQDRAKNDMKNSKVFRIFIKESQYFHADIEAKDSIEGGLSRCPR